LLEVLHRLTDLGNTVIIIEHNLDVIRSADWILDLGPEGGEDGGRLVAKGTPAEVAATLGSHTGEFLRRYFPVAELKPIPATSPEGNGNHVQAARKRGVKSADEGNKSAVRKRKSASPAGSQSI
jgi:excinuclease ABC subunit A